MAKQRQEHFAVRRADPPKGRVRRPYRGFYEELAEALSSSPGYWFEVFHAPAHRYAGNDEEMREERKNVRNRLRNGTERRLPPGFVIHSAHRFDDEEFVIMLMAEPEDQ